MEIKCERCVQKEGQIKNGKTRTRSHRYICKHCRKIYMPVQKENTYRKKIANRAIELYMEGNNGRAVEQILKNKQKYRI